MKKKIPLLKPKWGARSALCLAVILSGCGQEKTPEPLTFTHLSGVHGDRIQAILDHYLDNLFTKAERESGVQGKVSIADVKTRTNTTRVDRIVKFEHPKMCYMGACPFILMRQQESYINDIEKWQVDLMQNGFSFAVGSEAIQNRLELFIPGPSFYPHYIWDTDDQYYANDGAYKLNKKPEGAE